MRKLYNGTNNSSKMNYSNFSALGSSSLCLCLEALVKVFIFLLRTISQTSYLDILANSMRRHIILRFRLYEVFS